jgi:M6 family metalloprotease-like protein
MLTIHPPTRVLPTLAGRGALGGNYINNSYATPLQKSGVRPVRSQHVILLIAFLLTTCSGGGSESDTPTEHPTSPQTPVTPPTPPAAPPPNQPPTIRSFTATPSSGTVPLSVTFTLDAWDPDGTIARVEWDFDGNGIVDHVTTTLETIFTYCTNGNFTVIVTVVDNAGARASACTTVSVQGFLLSAGSNPQPNEGPTDYNLHLRPIGELRAVMIFVDFPDAPQSEATTDLFNLLVPNSVTWFTEVSNGRMSLNVTPQHRWYRMPKTSVEYGIVGRLTFERHRAYIADAIAVSDGDVNYSEFKIVYIVSARGAAIPLSPAFHGFPGTGIVVDGQEIRHAVTFGSDIRTPRPNYGSHVLIHETGHLIGLPDLHDYQAHTLKEAIRHAGGWDIMSFNTPGAHFMAWHKLKLGWLAPSEIMCIASQQVIETTITPLEVLGGLKAVVISIGPSTAYVVEVRQRIGQDTRLCDEGVLIYRVDAMIPNGSGPIRVMPAQSGSDAKQVDMCGPLYDAPFDVGPDEVSKFQDVTIGLSVEVVRSSASTPSAFVVKIVLQ